MLKQKIAIVTGANRGLGLETVRLLAKNDIHVIATTRNTQKCEELVAKLAGEGINISSFAYESSNLASAKALFNYVQTNYGRLDILINNAGIAPDLWKPSIELTSDVFREIMDVNVVAPFQLTQLFLPLMQLHGYGRVVNLSSEVGSLTNSEMGSSLGYSASKTALNSITKTMATELKAYPDIKINSAAPGWCKTDMGGPNAHRSAEEGADTVVWLATLDKDGPSGGFYRDREVYPW